MSYSHKHLFDLLSRVRDDEIMGTNLTIPPTPDRLVQAGYEREDMGTSTYWKKVLDGAEVVVGYHARYEDWRRVQMPGTRGLGGQILAHFGAEVRTNNPSLERAKRLVKAEIGRFFEVIPR